MTDVLVVDLTVRAGVRGGGGGLAERGGGGGLAERETERGEGDGKAELVGTAKQQCYKTLVRIIIL